MSQVSIRAALETALAAMTPAITTSWENVSFVPPASSVPYQAAYLLFATPDNPTFGNKYHRENGIFQVSLNYPLQAGDSAARTRAELIRTTFYRGASFASGGVTVTIEKTPEITSGTPDGDRWMVAVKIRFYASIIT